MAGATVLSACSPQGAIAPLLRARPTQTPTEATHSGDSGLSAERGVTLISQVYALLLEGYIEPVDSSSLLLAAWDGFSGALPAEQPHPAGPSLSGTNPAADLAAFRRAYLEAAAQVPGGNEAQARLAHAAVRKMAESLGDCHTSYSDPQQLQEQLKRLEGSVQYGGVGIRIKRQENAPVVVWELLAGGSARKAGIKPGDAIVRVDGKDVRALTLDQLASAIRGPEGSQVRLTVERGDSHKTRDFTLKRVALADPAFESTTLNGNIAYLRLYSFSEEGRDDLLRAIGEAEAKQPRGWILDLRTNGGGDVAIVTSLLSKFLKDGPFGYQVDRRGQTSALGPDGTLLPRQHPMVVLVSDSTASGAEVFAAALQHYHAATVVGTRTAGCVGIATRLRLDDDSGLSLSVSKLLGPDGRELNHVGLTPDEVVEVSRADLAAGRDPQVQRAQQLLGAG